MSSILTNSSAMVALDTLRGINKNLGQVQSEISTGKKISSSTDNAAIWSISTVMQSDVDSFSMVSDSLNLGSATVGVARSAAEEVTSLLQTARETIVAANDASITDSDRTKYNTDLTEIKASIASIVDSASFNGQNLLKAGDAVSVLSSLNRQADGTVTTGNVDVARKDLTTTAAVDAVVAVDAVAAGTILAADEAGATLSTDGVIDDDDGTQTETITITTGTSPSETTYNIDIGTGSTQAFVVEGGLDQDQIATELASQITQAITDLGSGNVFDNLTVAASGAVLTFTNGSSAGDASEDITLALGTVENAEVVAVEAADAVAAGGLFALEALNISDQAGATAALNAIDGLLQTAIDSTAFFGSKQSRIDNQNEFVTSLSDSLKTGIGALTDANLEEASARLQSLQVQQQLGIQALSIANSSPQQLLSLFQ